jgi:predicted transposase YbfD/YdcC
VAARAGGRLTAGLVVALDGKTPRRSHDRTKGRAAIHLGSAWASGARLALGQVKVDAKANESVAIPGLLRVLALAGCVVTVDAIGCQTAIARAVREQGADDVLALTGNQPAAEQAARAIFADARAPGFRGLAHDRHGRTEQGHGRIETRRRRTISAPDRSACLNEGAAGRGCAASRWSRPSGRSAGRPAARRAPTSAA